MSARDSFRHLTSNMKLLPYRLVYGSRFHIGSASILGKMTKIVVSKTGTLEMGSCFEARRMDYLSVQSGSMKIGNHVFLNQNVSITCMDHIEIGNDVLIANNVVIVDHDHDGNGSFVSRPVIIKDHAWIGANAVILKGVTIGEHAVVAAGAVVTKDVADGTTVMGIPARVQSGKN